MTENLHAKINKKLDCSNMEGAIKSFPDQIEQAFSIIDNWSKKKDYINIRNIMVLGMGGSAIGGDLGIVKTGDKMKIDLNKRRVDLLIAQSEFKKRRKNKKIFKTNNQTPWQEIFRNTVGQLEDGACINSRGTHLDISNTKGIPRNTH